MYKGYNLQLNKSDLVNLESDTSEFDKYSKQIRNEMHWIREQIGIYKINESTSKNFFNNKNTIDGSELINEWFPQINADIFISHSHKNEDLAISLAAWLKNKFGLDSFIDSTVWGYSDELLKKLDEEYCYDPTTRTYDYKLRNYTTSQIHLMLGTALSKMINEAECLFFLNTQESLSFNAPSKKQTSSAWIYYELITSKFINKHHPRKVPISLQEKFANKKEEMPSFTYDVGLSHLGYLTVDDLINWRELQKKGNIYLEMKGNNNIHPLDYLYFLRDI